MTNKRQKIIVYIDGFNLHYGINGLNQFYKWLDLQILAKSFAQDGDAIISVKYFTSKLNGSSDSVYRQSIYLDALSRHCNIKPITGNFVRARKCKHCDGKNNEEKQTDVNIACEMMQDLYESNFDIAYLVSGDSDLVAPVRKIVNMNKIIIVAFPPNRKSKELIEVASSYFDIKESRLKKCQLPDEIATKRNPLKRPEKWQKQNKGDI
ncbi:hypothetical protein BTHERMOSOX_1645 [Bathymodiolus thermophilus thioautotrophic gill symbiont]|uniref:NYN domain-containing protein n=1 Tax=Bathymodiolus thermophilus thioautotrophic gill symbiont TaxID=2360 RepID=UPI0010B150EC|nr:NYN domain-containing protein [Bathymodiolus thermophilus thioautotrophic gill symbiont]SGZ81065.1 hypothetical protein BTHERMOSOX_1645 [Bathymodiolus thermophilus thioautotrophic gill symbiont]